MIIPLLPGSKLFDSTSKSGVKYNKQLTAIKDYFGTLLMAVELNSNSINVVNVKQYLVNTYYSLEIFHIDI